MATEIRSTQGCVQMATLVTQCEATYVSWWLEIVSYLLLHTIFFIITIMIFAVEMCYLMDTLTQRSVTLGLQFRTQ